ncbi:hypothetical protein L7F22_010813 [Adiantum nelumboides]|nr:hypothetical protein [Adiantum nelumboides]MCO5557252.1 hypothetical protein [Adiantum nelumboides]
MMWRWRTRWRRCGGCGSRTSKRRCRRSCRSTTPLSTIWTGPLSLPAAFSLSNTTQTLSLTSIPSRLDGRRVIMPTSTFKVAIIEGGHLAEHSNLGNLSYSGQPVAGPKPNTCITKWTFEFDESIEHDFHEFIKEEMSIFGSSIESHIAKA